MANANLAVIVCFLALAGCVAMADEAPHYTNGMAAGKPIVVHDDGINQKSPIFLYPGVGTITASAAPRLQWCGSDCTCGTPVLSDAEFPDGGPAAVYVKPPTPTACACKTVRLCNAVPVVPDLRPDCSFWSVTTPAIGISQFDTMPNLQETLVP